MELLCRNRVQNYDHWRALFDGNAAAGAKAGLTVLNVWREEGDPDNVFFLFSVQSRERAEAFMHSPESARMGERAGVLDGEYHFVQRQPV